jgi:hypothetical protein
MDQKRWDEWANIFAEDVTASITMPRQPQDGLPELRCNGRRAGGDDRSSQGPSPHQLVTCRRSNQSDYREGDLGNGRLFALLNCIYKGYGHYERNYVKEKDGWKMKTILLWFTLIQWRETAEKEQVRRGSGAIG